MKRIILATLSVATVSISVFVGLALPVQAMTAAATAGYWFQPEDRGPRLV